jgi:hypothetical protein
MAPFPRDADLKNGSRREGEGDTHAKQYQGKDWATKAQQDLSINVAIYSWLLACKNEVDKLYNYAKSALRVSP